MPIKKSNNERMRDISREISGEVYVRVETTLTPNWLRVTLHYGEQTTRMETVSDIDAAVEICLSEAEALLGMYAPATLEEVKQS